MVLLRRLLMAYLALTFTGVASAHEADTGPTPNNVEMTAIFEADQAARNDPASMDWDKIAAGDAERRKRTQELLDAGALEGGDDFYHAAFVFQHGGTPSDYLMAHTLAVIAIDRGHPSATWIAAATLDRYLQSIDKKQIYGTQYQATPEGGATQDPYERDLVSDSLRQLMDVPVQAEQEKRLDKFAAQFREMKAAAKE